MSEAQGRYLICLLIGLFILLPLGWGADMTVDPLEWELFVRILLTYYLFSIPFGWLFFRNLEHLLWNVVRKIAGFPPIERKSVRGFFVAEPQSQASRKEAQLPIENDVESESKVNYNLILTILLLPFTFFKLLIRVFLCGLPGMVLFPIYTAMYIKEKKQKYR